MPESATLTRAGCRLVDVQAGGGRTVATWECPPGYASADLLEDLTERDARHPWVQKFAALFTRFGADAPRALQAWVQTNVRFAHEKGEIFAAPWLTVAFGYGDCDDHARLVGGALLALGYRVAFGYLEKSDKLPRHVWARAFVDGAWVDLETTVAARYGEDPRAAARRVDARRPDMAQDDMSFRDAVADGRLLVEGGERVWLRVVMMPDASWPGAREAVETLLRALGFADGVVYLPGEAAPAGGPPGWADDVADAPGGGSLLRVAALYARPESATRGTSWSVADGVHADVFRAWASPVPTLDMGAVSSSALAQARATLPWWTDDDFRALADIAKRRRMNVRDLVRVLVKESGLNPRAANIQNGYVVAAGLIQVTPIAAPGLGLSEAQRVDLLNTTVAHQLPLVDRYFASVEGFRRGTAYPSALAVYHAVFHPASMGSGDDPGLILFRAGEAGYRQNPQLIGKLPNGQLRQWIQLGDLQRFVDTADGTAAYRAAMVRLDALGLSGGTSWVAGAAVVLAVGSGLAYALARWT